jgi:hypothetical protein
MIQTYPFGRLLHGSERTVQDNRRCRVATVLTAGYQSHVVETTPIIWRTRLINQPTANVLGPL